MYGELYQYFIQHKQLNVPGIGTFLLERKPAVADFPNKIIHPPSYTVVLQHSSALPARGFFTWLASMLGISDRDAVIRFNDFAFDLKKRIMGGDKVKWEGVGTIFSGLAGEIRFEPALKDTTLEAPVKAEKVIREKSEHTVRVGEDEKTAAQMIEYFNQPVARRNYWWAWALAVALLLTMFIGWYFSSHGMQASSTGNNGPLQAQEPPATYKVN